MITAEYRQIGNELKEIPIRRYTRWARWTRYEDKLLRELYPSLGAKELAERLARPPKSIDARLTRLGLRQKVPTWAKDEKRLFAELSDPQISALTGRSLTAVRVKRCRMKAYLESK